MSMKTLGRMERVPLRDIWESEDQEFTPWLAQPNNIKMLEETLDIELQVEGRETSVGPFQADLLCRDTVTNGWVLVENQLERTDHTHLGQLMTYAAGLDAVTVVWIAEHFKDEHRAALDWLNNITDETFNFFGLEIEVWRVEDSPPAPRFNVICQPNRWAKQTARIHRVSDSLSEQQKMHLRFWQEFYKFVEEKSSQLRPTQPYPRHYMRFAVGKTDFGLSAVLSTANWHTENSNFGELRAEVVIDHENSDEYFEILKEQQHDIENELGSKLRWYNPEDKVMCRIFWVNPVDVSDEKQWPEYRRWLLDNLEALNQVFRPRITKLS